MAIPATPSNFIAQSSNQQTLLSWDLVVGATSYVLERSQDNVTYTALATVSGSPLATQYLDTSAVLGTQYWYRVASANTDGQSAWTAPQAAITAPTAEMTLATIRTKAQERADLVNSKFVTNAEWRGYINQAMFELYDLLITAYEDYYIAQPAYFNLTGNQSTFPLPNGTVTFQDATGANFVPRPFYKLRGVDLAVNTAQNAWVTLSKYNFIDRNNYLYPNSTSTIYGVYNMRYRVMGGSIMFIPNPAAGQQVRLWYIPRLKELLLDTDTTDVGISGWVEYVIVRAAKYALDKQEADSSKLDQEILFLTKRIEASASNRDTGQADTISNTRNSDWTAGYGPFGGRGSAGW